jgi:APA family basic amino acid/polyamine antiporter
VARRRRRTQSLERVLGTPALFSTAYGNVGSSIYYALGVTAVFALGLTPLVFVIAGLIFAMTAATYAEGTVRYPEAGGSSSFARHAFNEGISFGAAWAQLLVYVVTIATSAFFVPHYLSIFWEPLRENPWDIVGGAVVIVVLVALNIVGIQEAARLNIGLAVIDFATQALLVVIGFVLVFSPEILLDNVHFGVAPTWANFALAIPVAMLAYTGIETVSNLAEEARDPVKSIPSSIRLVAIAVFAIYFTLPLVALSALPVERVDGEYRTLLGLPPEDGGFANDPVLGVVQNLGLERGLANALEIYVGILAATILFIATNAGVIGASRVTYSMANYRQMPDVFRRLHRRYRTPWVTLVVFAGLAPLVVILPGETNFLGTLYSFGATLSFTVAHASITALRVRRPDDDLQFRARPNWRIRGVDWPLFALVGGTATFISWLVVVVQNPNARWTGLAWLAVGLVGYVVYRRFAVHESPLATVRAPALILGPSLEVEYHTIVVPVVRSHETEEALVAAARLAAERRATIAAVAVVEVPRSLPIDAELPEAEEEAHELLDSVREILEPYGVRVITRLARGRSAADVIVEEATRRQAELVVLGARRRDVARRTPVFGRTVASVLERSPCRVLLAAA